MSLQPLIKREINIVKWVFLFGLLFGTWYLFLLTQGGLNRAYVSNPALLYGSYSANPFFSLFYNQYLFTVFAVILSIVQFYGLNQLFLFSLPVRKSDLIRLKILCGVLTYSFWIILYGIAIVYIFKTNEYWIKDLYVHAPKEIYNEFARHNSLAVVFQYLSILWLGMTATYIISVFIQVLLKNKVMAGIATWLVLWFPAFLSSDISSRLNSIFYQYRNQYNSSVVLEQLPALDKIKFGINLFSFPEFYRFTPVSMENQFYSSVNGIEELRYISLINIIEGYIPKAIIATLIVVLLIKFIFSCFPTSSIGDGSQLKNIIKNKFFILFVSLAMFSTVVVSLNTYKSTSSVMVSPHEMNINKTIDTEKYNACNTLETALMDITTNYARTRLNSQEDFKRKNQLRAADIAKLFNLPTSIYNNINKSSNDLNYSFETHELLSKSNIPNFLEELGFEGLRDFINLSDEKFLNRDPEDVEGIVSLKYFYYDTKAKAFFIYTIEADSNTTDIFRLRLDVSFRATLSYPNEYMDLIKSMEDENHIFSLYFAGGNRDALVFENPNFIAHESNVHSNSNINSELKFALSEYPQKVWLYGDDGTIDTLKFAFILSPFVTFENANLDTMDTYLDVLNLTPDDREKVKEAVTKAIDGNLKKKKARIGDITYDLHTGYFRDRSRLVEIYVKNAQRVPQ